MTIPRVNSIGRFAFTISVTNAREKEKKRICVVPRREVINARLERKKGKGGKGTGTPNTSTVIFQLINYGVAAGP